MLAKVISQHKRYTTARALVDYALSLDEGQAQALAQDLPPDAAALVQYAAREGVESAGVSQALAALGISDPLKQQREITCALDRIVQRVRERGVAAEQPLYHVVVTWKPGEKPTDAHAQAAAEHVLQVLGMRDAAAFYVVHRDKEHHHIHLVACRYHPDTLEYLGPPKRDFLVLDRAMRELELAQGWAHSPGPHQVIDGEIVLLSRRERARGRDASAERAEGVPGILGYAEHHRLRQALESAQNWQQAHAAAQALGLELTPKGGGLVLSGVDAQNRKRVIKLSDLGIRSGAWQRRLGVYEPPVARVQPRATLADWQRDVMRGRMPEIEGPRPTGRDPARRAAQREARARAREELYQRYREHVQQLPAARREALENLRARQRAERVALLKTSRDARSQQFQLLAAAHGAEVARAMLDGQVAAALDALKKRHQAERQSVMRQYSSSWREFLEMRARLHGDPAAISALRGIIYREKRKQREKSPGFEGEDLRADPHSPQEWAGGIEGELRQWTLADAVAEVSRDGTTITYRDRDGNERIRDQGQRIDVVQGRADEDAAEAALLLAAQRYGGEVFITGDETFREHAARLAARRGIAVANIELQQVWQEEREKVAQGVDTERTESKMPLHSSRQPVKEVQHER